MSILSLNTKTKNWERKVCVRMNGRKEEEKVLNNLFCHIDIFDILFVLFLYFFLFCHVYFITSVFVEVREGKKRRETLQVSLMHKEKHTIPPSQNRVYHFHAKHTDWPYVCMYVLLCHIFV